MPIAISDAPGTLPAAAKKLYVGAFNGAYGSTCKDPKKRRGGGTRDACSARIAWAAVKKKYKQVGDKWVAKSFVDFGCVKSLGGDRIGGYLALWGDEDTKDLVGEFFSPETNFWLGTWGALPTLYHHGYNPELRGFKSIVGTWDTFEKDTIGLWVEGELQKHHEYRQAIDTLIEEKSMYLSSGALPKPGYIEIEPNGHIKSWAIIEGSLTPTPMEHRLANIDFLKSTIDLGAIAQKEVQMNEEAKSLWEKLSELLGFSQKADPEVEPVEEPVEEVEMPEDVKAFLEGVTTQVATSVAEAFNKALAGLQGTVKAELDEMKTAISEFDARLDGTEKSIEAKVAEKFESLPPIVAAPVTETVASTKGDDVPVTVEHGKTGNEFVDDIVGGIVDGMMGKMDGLFMTPQLEVLDS